MQLFLLCYHDLFFSDKIARSDLLKFYLSPFIEYEYGSQK